MPTSAIIKTEAITLRVAPFSNTSHVVTWLTPTHGKIATVVKGACRPKSLMMGQYDIGFLCELLFYERERNGVHVIKECSVINAREVIRGNWQLTAATSYLCHLASIVTPEAGHAPELYRLLRHSLSRLSSLAPQHRQLFLAWFELRLLSVLGVPPLLTNCTLCNAPVEAHQGSLFSAAYGGFICSRCKDASRNSHALLQVAGDTIALMRRLMAASDFRLLVSLKCKDSQYSSIGRCLGAFLEHHVDLAPENRAVAHQMLKLQEQFAESSGCPT